MSKKIKRTKDELIDALKIMMLSRAIDEKVSILIRQGKASFLIAGAGHEAAQVAVGKRLKAKYDWVYPYYRDQAVLLSLGITPEDIMLEMLGKADDPANGGRQMGNHWGHKDFNIPSQSSPTGTQFYKLSVLPWDTAR